MKLTGISAVYLRTKNDRNGNPRRGWLIQMESHPNDTIFIDEGYRGSASADRFFEASAMPMVKEAIHRAPTLEVTPSTYLAMKRSKGSGDWRTGRDQGFVAAPPIEGLKLDLRLHRKR